MSVILKWKQQKLTFNEADKNTFKRQWVVSNFEKAWSARLGKLEETKRGYIFRTIFPITADNSQMKISMPLSLPGKTVCWSCFFLPTAPDSKSIWAHLISTPYCKRSKGMTLTASINAFTTAEGNVTAHLNVKAKLAKQTWQIPLHISHCLT